MKKLICVLLTVVALLTFVACGGENGGENTSQTKAAFTLSYNGQTVKIDAKADAVVSAWGEPKKYQELPTCGIGDLDKLYDYGSVRIRTYQVDGVDYISVIELMDDLVETAEGVAIGSGKDLVSQKYGTADKTTAVAWTYCAEGMDLEIHFNADDTVKSIVYRGKN